MRINWDPADEQVATCANGVATIGDRVIGTDVLDLRWLPNGQLFTIASQTLRWTRGDLVENQLVYSGYRNYTLVRASIAANGERFVAVEQSGRHDSIAIVDATGETLWRPHLYGADIHPRPGFALSGNGKRFALAYDTENPGRGVVVYDIDKQTLIDRTWAEQPLDRAARVALAFDHAGSRLAQAVPEVDVPALGVIRIKAGDVYPRRHTGGATAVALERTGNLVAYAYATTPRGARGRLRFDYLEAGVKGPAVVDVLDTQTLECELPEIAALAFSHDRRKLACMSSTGAVEIVPVP